MNRLVAVLLCGLSLWCVLLTVIMVKNPSIALSPQLQLGETPVIAFVHGDSIQSGFDFIAEQREFLFSAVQEAQSALEMKGVALQNEAQELIEYGNSPEVSSDEVQMVQKRLGEIQAQLNQMQEEGINQLAELEASLNAKAASKLKEEVMFFALENNIDVILNWGPSGEGVLFGSDGFDITHPFLEFINDRFQSGAAQSATTSDKE